MRKAVVGVMLGCICVLCAGCVPLVIGAAAGGLGAYAVSQDTIEGDTDTAFASLWDAAVEMAKVRGIVKTQDYSRGYIEFEAKPNRAWIKLSRLTETATRVRVSSRKHHLPNLDYAQDVFVRLMERAKSLASGQAAVE